MKDSSFNASPTRFVGRRRLVSVSAEQLVKTSYLPDTPECPLVVEPADSSMDVYGWIATNRDLIQQWLLKHVAILFRGCSLHTAADFERFVFIVGGELLTYFEATSPRTRVTEKVYTSTDFPADQTIFLHNERSYSVTFPRKIFFWCEIPPGKGGRTPIADTRKIYQRIEPSIRDAFAKKGWMYVRNFGDGLGLSWQRVFQTEDRSVVEDYCRLAKIEYEWRPGGRLRTYQIRPAISQHPVTGERLWFNHATFYHVTTLEPAVRQALVSHYREEDLPNNTYYGDGSPIEPAVIAHLQRAYMGEAISFSWQRGDILMLDNMLAAHGRTPFEHPRKILVAMTEPYTREDMTLPTKV